MKIAHYHKKPLNVAHHGKWFLTYFDGHDFRSLAIELLTDEEGKKLSVGDKIKVTLDPFFVLQELEKDTSSPRAYKIMALEQLSTHYKNNETILRMIKMHLSKLYLQ